MESDLFVNLRGLMEECPTASMDDLASSGRRATPLQPASAFTFQKRLPIALQKFDRSLSGRAL